MQISFCIRSLIIIISLCILHVDSSFANSMQQDLQKIINYFNNLKRLKVNFEQKDYNGLSKGKITLSKPGKIRIDYYTPVPIILIDNNHKITYYDVNLDQISYIAEKNDILELLTSNLYKEKIARYSYIGADHMKITFNSNDTLARKIDVIASLSPVRIRKINIYDDSQNNANDIKLSLQDHSYPRMIDDSLFYLHKFKVDD